MNLLDAAVAAVGVDPRELRARLVGQPEQTLHLARLFEEVGETARETHERARYAHVAVAVGFNNDGVPVLDAPAHDQASAVALGRRGQDMDDTAAFLRRSVTALDEAERVATRALDRMTADLDALTASTNRALAAGATDIGPFVTQAVAVVTSAATTIQEAITTYDRGLAGGAADLAARGYVPTAATTAGFLDPEQRAAVGEFLSDFGDELVGDLAEAGSTLWSLLPVRGIWESDAYSDDLARYASGAVDSLESAIDDPVGTLLAAGKDLIAYDHWVNGEPGKATGHIVAEVLLGGAAGKLLRVLRRGGAPDATPSVDPPGRTPSPALDPAARQEVDTRLTDLEREHADDFQRLSADPDKGGNVSPSSQDEARVALDMRERGMLPPDVTRPPNASEGDFYSPSTGSHYDLKGLHSDWPPLNNQRDRSAPFPQKYGPENGERYVDKIEDQIDNGRVPVIDTRNADQAAIADLQQRVAERGLSGDIIWYP